MRAVWPLLAALFLCGAFLGAALPRIALGVAGAGLLSAALFLVWAARDGLDGIESYFKGARGEEWIAALLATLPPEYHVFHDVPCGEKGGIDHVVVGPRGLFAIETKCWSGQVTVEDGAVLFNGTVPSRPPLAQARASAHALTAFLSERIDAVPACVPILCFASNTLVQDSLKQDDTLVCNAKALLLLLTAHTGHVSPDEIERIVKVMERKAS